MMLIEFMSNVQIDYTIEIGRRNHSKGKDRTTYNKTICHNMDRGIPEFNIIHYYCD